MLYELFENQAMVEIKCKYCGEVHRINWAKLKEEYVDGDTRKSVQIFCTQDRRNNTVIFSYNGSFGYNVGKKGNVNSVYLLEDTGLKVYFCENVKKINNKKQIPKKDIFAITFDNAIVYQTLKKLDQDFYKDYQTIFDYYFAEPKVLVEQFEEELKCLDELRLNGSEQNQEEMKRKMTALRKDIKFFKTLN